MDITDYVCRSRVQYRGCKSYFFTHFEIFFISAFLFLFHFYVPLARPISKVTMNWFQFGNIQHASLILDEVG